MRTGCLQSIATLFIFVSLSAIYAAFFSYITRTAVFFAFHFKTLLSVAQTVQRR
jgi:hypothetical protein